MFWHLLNEILMNEVEGNDAKRWKLWLTHEKTFSTQRLLKFDW